MLLGIAFGVCDYLASRPVTEKMKIPELVRAAEVFNPAFGLIPL